jgi:hypothetical protein
MKPRLVWRPPAFDRMSEIVRSAPDRKAEFAAALRELSAVLTADPSAGESREPPYRVVVCGQLTFRFRPAPDEGRVYVVRVWLRKRRQ